MLKNEVFSNDERNGIDNQAVEIDIDDKMIILSPADESKSNNSQKLNKSLELASSSQSISVNYFQENYSFNKIKSDNVFYSSKNYITKYYKPSSNCKNN